MKRKLWILLLALVMVFSFAAPAMAYEDYGLIYDDTGQLDNGDMPSLNNQFTEISDQYGIEVRCDIVTDLEGYSIAEYADIFWNNYDYGYGEDHSGVFLMVQVHADDTGMVFDDYYIKWNGAAASIFGTENAANALFTAVDANFNSNSWAGDLEQDKKVCNAGLSAYGETLKSFFASAADTPVTTSANDDSYVVTGSNQAQIAYVTDDEGYLSSDDLADLNSQAAAISEKYGCGVYAMIVKDYTLYNFESVYEAAKMIYLDYSMGWGDDYDGVFLLLSMADRDYSLIAYGDFGNAAFTDYGKDQMAERFLPDFGNDDWYGGFCAYLTACDEYIASAREGNYIDIGASGYDTSDGSYTSFSWVHVAIVVLVPFIIALIVCLIFRAQMKSVRKGAEAGTYVVGGVNFTRRDDRFTHTTEVRRVIERDNDHGGTSVDSGGFSGKSGKF